MQGAEERNLLYLFKLKQSGNVKKLIAQLFGNDQWVDAGQKRQGLDTELRPSGVTRNPAIRGHLGSGQRNLAQKQRLAPPRLGADLTTYSFPIARVFHGVTDPRGTSSAAA
jgi:hypothetical protein